MAAARHCLLLAMELLLLLGGGAAAVSPAAAAARTARATAVGKPARAPPMGWSSWNYLSMHVSAPLLLETADALAATGLRDLGYVYVIATEGWEPGNRTRAGDLQPAPSFTNGTVRALSDQLHAKGFKLGIYGEWRLLCTTGSDIHHTPLTRAVTCLQEPRALRPVVIALEVSTMSAKTHAGTKSRE
jgi:hypothetical protein